MTKLREAAQAALEKFAALVLASQRPYGWMVEGVPTVVRGSLAEDIQRGTARRIGGACKAFPIYRGEA